MSVNRIVLGLFAAFCVGCSANDGQDAGGTTTSSGGATTSGGTNATGGSMAAGASAGGAGAGAGGTGGSSGGASSAGTGGTSGSAGSAGAPHVVTNCDSLGGVGEWEDITPPEVALGLPGPGDCTYGVGSFVVDPSDPATLILGTCQMGVWKSTDCGASWQRLNTGTNGAVLDNGRQWTMAVDPEDSQVIFANSGYNHWIQGGTWEGNGVSGLFKSENGGVDWKMIWPPTGELSDKVEYNFVGGVEIDPADHLHLLLSFHAKCKAPYTEACVGESHDGGETWELVNGDASWSGGEGQGIHFAGSSWIWGSESNGLWLTTNSGDDWTLVDASAVGHGFGPLYQATDGAFYLGTVQGIKRSPDGVTWTLVPNSGGLIAGLIGDGTSIYASKGFPWNVGNWPEPYDPFWSSPETDGQTWTQYPSPKLGNGGGLAYSQDHNLLYSSNEYAGFWRVVTK